MTSRITIVLLFLIIPVFKSISQSNYQDGYIIKNNGDTVRGFIDYRAWEKSPEKIYFKLKLTDEPASYLPYEIIEFGASDEIYKGAVIDIEESPRKADKFEEGSELLIRKDTAFVQTLIHGKKSLYYYKNARNHENFYILIANELVLLEYKKYLRQFDGKAAIAENKSFLSQLNSYLDGCPDIFQKLQNTNYQKKSLLSLFKKYYECLPAEPSFLLKKPNFSIETGALLSIFSTSLDFSSSVDSYADLYTLDFKPATGVSGGFFLDLILPGNQGKWSINNELMLSSYKATAVNDVYDSENYQTTTTSEIGGSQLTLNNSLRFKFPIGQNYVFVNAGIFNALMLNAINIQKTEANFYGTEIKTEKVAVDLARKYEQGLLMGLGFRHKKFSFETRYIRGNGISGVPQLKSTTNTLAFFIGYRF